MHQVEANIAYLVIMDGAKALDAIGDRVGADMLEDQACQSVFKAALEMHIEGRYVDASTLPKEVAPSVQEIVSQASTSMAYLDHHVRELHQLCRYRRAQTLGKQLASSSEDSDFDRLFSSAIAQLEDSAIVEDDNPVQTAQEALAREMANIESQMASSRGLLGFKTGFPIVSTRTQGAQRKQLWLLGGLPGFGKTMLAQAWIKAAMLRDDAKVFIASLEMSTGDWMRRFIADFGSVDINEAILTKDLASIQRMKTAASHVTQLPLTIADKGGISLFALKRKMKQQQKAGANYFVIDHLGLLDHGGNEIDGYKKTTSWLKAFAKKHNVFVLVLCQLNGKGEQDATDGKDPRLGHVAYGSSGPNQDADVVFIISKDRDLHCVKNRNGMDAWNVHLEMNGSFCRISEAKYSK